MNTIRILKTKLAETLEANREKHIAEFTEAFKLWREAQRDAMWEAYSALGESYPEKHAAFALHTYGKPKPESHAAEYTRALGKLALSVDEVIELGEDEYRQFIEDDWAWQRAFKDVTSTYLGG